LSFLSLASVRLSFLCTQSDEEPTDPDPSQPYPAIITPPDYHSFNPPITGGPIQPPQPTAADDRFPSARVRPQDNDDYEAILRRPYTD